MLLAFALWAAYSLRLGEVFVPGCRELALVGAAPLLAMPVFMKMGLYRLTSSCRDGRAIWTAAKAISLAALLWTALAFMAQMAGAGRVPRAVPLLYWFIGAVLVAGVRFDAGCLSWLSAAFWDQPGRIRIGKLALRTGPLFWCGFLFGVIILLWLKLVVFHSANGPTCFGDEWLYRRNAEHLFAGTPIPDAHYPPLYSLVLAPAFFLQNWYDAMIRINSLVSTLLAVPVWLLAREFLDRRTSAVAVLLSLMIPFHLIYPAFILSENLFMPLFVLAVFLAFKGADAGMSWAALLGLTLAAAHLTRHIMLPAVFILSAFWIAIPYVTASARADFPSIRKLWPNVAILLLCYGALYSCWTVYMHLQGVPVQEAAGFGISGIKAPYTNPGGVALWLTVYGSYLVLAAAPFLVPMLAHARACPPGRPGGFPMSREAVLAWVTVLLSGCYWLVAANHSFSAWYNQASPKYLIGRYLMFLTPLYIVLGLTALQRIVNDGTALKRGRIWAATLLALAMIAAARWILHGRGIWELPPWFASIVFNSPDAFAYKHPLMLVAALLGTAALGRILTAGSPGSRRFLMSAACLVLLFWHAALYTCSAGLMPLNLLGLHPRNIAPVLSREVSPEGTALDLYYEVKGLDERTMRLALKFWGVEYDREKLHAHSVYQETTADRGAFFVLSQHEYPIPAVLTYEVGGRPFHLYRMEKTP